MSVRTNVSKSYDGRLIALSEQFFVPVIYLVCRVDRRIILDKK